MGRINGLWGINVENGLGLKNKNCGFGVECVNALGSGRRGSIRTS